jgi:hypothetical protein
VVASVPEFTNRTISTLGTWRATNSACSSSSSVGAPYIGPSLARRCTADSTDCGRSWPNSSGPSPITQSTYRFPSASTTWPPSPDCTNVGYGCGAARTVEFTPPTSTSSDRS